MLKNRTVIGIISIIGALVITFGASPFISRAFEGKKRVAVLKIDVLQGAEITAGDVELADRGAYGLPDEVYTGLGAVIGKFATAKLFAGSVVLPAMLSDTVDNSDSMLRSLGENEMAMSLPIKQYADGLSGKLLSGDIVKIVGYDAENKRSVIYPELQYAEVLTATTDSGADNINALAENENGDLEKPVTITLRLQSDAQAVRLAECIKNGAAQVVFVSRNPDNKAEFLQRQAKLIEELGEVNEKEPGVISGAKTPGNAGSIAEKSPAQQPENVTTEVKNGNA